MAAKSLELRLPFPPTVNHSHKHNKNGGVRLSAEARQFRDEVFVLCRNNPNAVTFEGPISLDVLAAPPDNRRRDLDNLLKSTLDALQHAGVFHDDSQIDQLSITRGWVTEKGFIHVRIETRLHASVDRDADLEHQKAIERAAWGGDV